MPWSTQLLNILREGESAGDRWGANSVGRKQGDCDALNTMKRVFKGRGSSHLCSMILVGQISWEVRTDY